MKALGEKKIKISSYFFAIYLLYTLFIWGCETIDLICYLFGVKQCSIISRIIVFVFLIVFIKWSRKYCLIERNVKISIITVLVSICVIAYGVIKCIIPDTNFDTRNYHLLVQQSGFTNNFECNFAPGDFQLWGFRLGDRLFYLFRNVLGLRAGTLLNSIIIILIYFQVVKIIQFVSGKRLENIRKKCSEKWYLFAGCIVFREDILGIAITFVYNLVIQSGTYMVEVITVPFALEMLYCLLYSKEKEDAVYFSLITGLFFAIKMTNIVYIIPMTILIIVKLRKELNLKSVILSIVYGIAPVCIYLIYNTYDAQNLIFPYYNKIFKSGYYYIDNFKDTRWGADSFIDIILWPIYVIFKPEYRQSELPDMAAFTFIGGAIACIIGFCRAVYVKKIDHNFILSIVSIIAFLLWDVTTGHIRYFIVGCIIIGILTIDFYSIILEKYPIFLSKVLIIFLILLSFYQPIYSVKAGLEGKEWSFRNSIEEDEKYVQRSNLQYLFKDQNIKCSVGKIDAFVLSQSEGGTASLFNNKGAIPVIKASYLSKISDKNKKDRAEQYINSIFDKYNNVYDVWHRKETDFSSFVDTENQLGYYITNVVTQDDAFCYEDRFSFVKIIQSGQKNTLNTHRDIFPLKEETGNCKVSTILGTNLNRGWFDKPLHFSINLTDGIQDYVIQEGEIQEGEWVKVPMMNLDLSQFDLKQDSYIYIKCYDAYGVEVQEPFCLFVLNFEIDYE